jgi:hypothetical protein
MGKRHIGPVVLAVIFLALATAGGVMAGAQHPSVVSDNPSNVTPNVESDSHVPNAAVYAIARAGDTIFVGGKFRTISDSERTQTYVRHNIMAFDATTGEVKSFAPTINGTVWTIVRRKNSLYVGGDFTSVNGRNRRALVKLNMSNGALQKNFRPGVTSGNVTQLAFRKSRLIAGGSLPGKLISLNTKNGNRTNYLQVAINGTVAPNAGPTKVYRFAVNAERTRLVGIGNFTSVGGKERRQAFMLRLRDNRASVHGWYYQPLNNKCSANGLPNYLRDVDFAPDGSYFVMVATGFVPVSGGLDRDICDATARFETNISDPVRPTWINYTGGDTLHSVSATGAAVYVQGHQRWLDNKFGVNDAGPGAVSRPGIGAINPDTGLALGWNPTKTREVGGKDFLATSTGLWVGSDGEHIGGEFRAGIAFMPLP